MSDCRNGVKPTHAESDTAATIRTASAISRSDKSAAGSVILRGSQVTLDTEIGAAFVTDCARNTEGSLTDADVKSKWGLADQAWENLASNEPLLDAVRAERERRIRNGDAAREAAQWHFAKTPNVLGGILLDEQVSPRHRIEAARELRQAVTNGSDAASGPAEKFVIHIDLGAGTTIHHELEHAPQPSSQPDEGELT